ncbi:hypothetical protein KKG83_03360 [Candidatus Micrarchaeota archaeon]|nr:hypothetical protein [Candidatus Micrarchaeota archaeon]
MPHKRRGLREGSSSYTIEDIIRDIKALNSSVLLLSQKMNYLVRNEKILGRNFIILNKKLKEVEHKKPVSLGSAVSEGISEELKDTLDSLDEGIKNNSLMLNEVKSDLNKMNSVYAKKEDLTELKYIVEAINPLEFITLDQAKELLAGKTPSKPKKKK